MSNQKKTHDLIRQNEQIVKKTQKHEANLQKNSTLYFQVGLIVCLLATFGLLEMKFQTNVPEVPPSLEIEPVYVVHIPLLKEKQLVKEAIKPQKPVKKSIDFEVVPDDATEKSLLKESTEPTMDTAPLHPDALPDLPSAPEDVDIPIHKVEIVPVYPGCEKAKDNAARKQCMSKKIAKLIQKKFEGTDIANNYGLTGKQKIDVQFKIDKTGKVTNIKTRSPHPKLDEEAVRVIHYIPEMTPGKQRDKNVDVIYNLPIIFHVQ